MPPPARLQSKGVYVLQQGSRFYVGKSSDIAKRIKEHKAGRGAACCRSSARRVRPITAAVTAGGDDDWESWERNETLTRMYEYGIDSVRGWMFTASRLTQQDRDSAYQQICEKFDLCRRCGGSAHFSKECTATFKAKWGQRLHDV